ncbi:MAG TPA: ATP phosphoribosyltransferase regulatory subunit, partial [Candidatus Nanoarchaeia archaeon]|nr:ATP phosphoribosyltransferase regulatory subunit [Candidatus Nanoarchaeia archaeon]
MELQTAKGVRDIPPEEKALKNQVVNTLTQVFELYGFAPLETPILERYETLAAKFAAGEASDALKETFTLTDQGDRKLGLRFDLTVPLARFMAMNPMLKMPFKRYEVGQVFRDGPLKLGRYREFWQCDIDTIGSNSMLADAEVLAVVDAVFKKLELDIIMKVNNRKVLNGILEQAGIADTKEKEQAIIAIDKLDKIGKEGVTKELQERGFSKKQIDIIFALVKENISVAELKKKLTNAEGLAGIQELEELFLYLKAMNISTAQFDVSLARGLAYYTGSVFEARLKKGQISSSVAGGGRWDNMIGGFMGG